MPQVRDISFFIFFFFNDTATTEIYTLSLHDALPIYLWQRRVCIAACWRQARPSRRQLVGDRKSTRLNSSHSQISYAVFCLKKKKNTKVKIPPEAQAEVAHQDA